MSAFAAAAQDEDGDTISALRAENEMLRQSLLTANDTLQKVARAGACHAQAAECLRETVIRWANRAEQAEDMLEAIGAGGVGKLGQPDHSAQHLNMVPQGWKLVPVEANMSMMQSALNASRRWSEYEAPLPRGQELWAAWVCWEAMLAAAPQPPAGEKTQPEIDHAHELRRHSRKLGEPVGETAGVMQRAADEIERLRAMLAAASQPKLYPLPDDLYGGSKDWRAGSYAERVEWLHLAYEWAKQEIARLEQPQSVKDCHQLQPQGEQEPVAWMYAEWSGSGRKVLTFEGPPAEPSPRDEVVNPIWSPLYTHPQPKREPLTDEQIRAAMTRDKIPYAANIDHYVAFARAIERAHGIGGET